MPWRRQLLGPLSLPGIRRPLPVRLSEKAPLLPDGPGPRPTGSGSSGSAPSHHRRRDGYPEPQPRDQIVADSSERQHTVARRIAEAWDADAACMMITRRPFGGAVHVISAETASDDAASLRGTRARWARCAQGPRCDGIVANRVHASSAAVSQVEGPSSHPSAAAMGRAVRGQDSRQDLRPGSVAPCHLENEGWRRRPD